MVKTVVVSGGFDPVHIGHVRLFHEARALGDKLIVILNNDNWLVNFKKEKPFMPEAERKEILEAFRDVDKVVLSFHKKGAARRDIGEEIRSIYPDVFANGGDRDPKLDDVPSEEYKVCQELGIEMVWGIGRGGKVQSSSWLTAAAEKNTKK